MQTPDCIFCKIIERAAHALIIYEDDRTIGFLPLEPSVAGHTVMVPKAHHADLHAIPDDLISALMTSCKTLARHWRDHLGSTGINVLHASGADAEQSVFHFHVHLFPRFAGDGLRTWPSLPHPGQTREEMHARFRLER